MGHDLQNCFRNELLVIEKNTHYQAPLVALRGNQSSKRNHMFMPDPDYYIGGCWAAGTYLWPLVVLQGVVRPKNILKALANLKNLWRTPKGWKYVRVQQLGAFEKLENPFFLRVYQYIKIFQQSIPITPFYNSWLFYDIFTRQFPAGFWCGLYLAFSRKQLFR
jgi:hypothetical protein